MAAGCRYNSRPGKSFLIRRANENIDLIEQPPRMFHALFEVSGFLIAAGGLITDIGATATVPSFRADFSRVESLNWRRRRACRRKSSSTSGSLVSGSLV